INLDGNFVWNTISEGLRIALTEGGLKSHDTRTLPAPCLCERGCVPIPLLNPADFSDHLRLRSEGPYAIRELFVCAKLRPAVCSVTGAGRILRGSGQRSRALVNTADSYADQPNSRGTS